MFDEKKRIGFIPLADEIFSPLDPFRLQKLHQASSIGLLETVLLQLGTQCDRQNHLGDQFHGESEAGGGGPRQFDGHYQRRPEVSQPTPFSRGGETVTVPDSQIDVQQEQNRMFLFDSGVSLNEIVQAVNRVGAAPGDLVAILEALKQAGSLTAELIVI